MKKDTGIVTFVSFAERMNALYTNADMMRCLHLASCCECTLKGCYTWTSIFASPFFCDQRNRLSNSTFGLYWRWGDQDISKRIEICFTAGGSRGWRCGNQMLRIRKFGFGLISEGRSEDWLGKYGSLPGQTVFNRLRSIDICDRFIEGISTYRYS